MSCFCIYYNWIYDLSHRFFALPFGRIIFIFISSSSHLIWERILRSHSRGFRKEVRDISGLNDVTVAISTGYSMFNDRVPMYFVRSRLHAKAHGRNDCDHYKWHSVYICRLYSVLCAFALNMHVKTYCAVACQSACLFCKLSPVVRWPCNVLCNYRLVNNTTMTHGPWHIYWLTTVKHIKWPAQYWNLELGSDDRKNKTYVAFTIL